MRSIYDNPYKYACVCNVPFELAKIACLKERNYRKEQRKHIPTCSCCGSKKILYEMGSYEEGYGDFVECRECGETFEPNEVKNIDYIHPFGYYFDAVLYFSNGEDKTGWMEACGAKSLEEWQVFAGKEILGR